MKRGIGLTCSALLAVGLAAACTAAIAANPFKFASSKANDKAKEDKDKKNDDEDEDEFNTKANIPFIGDYTQIVGRSQIVLHGVGLVQGLNGTGEDPPPSIYRQAILEDMNRRGIKNPNALLKSTNSAIVAITAYLPPLVRKDDHFDIEVRVPEGSKVKSLNGGWMLPAILREQAVVPGQGVKTGHEYAIASGPILVSASSSESGEFTALHRRGRIVGGGKSLIDRNLDIYLRNDFRSVRNASRLASAIGNRFFEYNKSGQRVPLAVAKTDQRIELKIMNRYRDNDPRFIEVIRKIAFRETEVARHVRMRALKEELLNGETSSQAAIKLEAIGDKAIPILKSGLQSSEIEVRFNAAMALAYLGDGSGLNALAEAARDERAFRIYALAAMSILEEPEAHVKLRDLMSADSAETRYGAFRALSILDENDPFIAGEKLNDQFKLHVLQTTGDPMVHLTNWKKTEVVLFGADQRVRTPLIARAGTRIMIAAPSQSETVTVTRFELGRESQKKTVSTRLADIIRAVSEFDASFPDVAQFLTQLDEQKNLAGRLEIDALPKAGRYYERNVKVAGAKNVKRERHKVGDANLVPNMFSYDENAAEKEKAVAKKDKPAAEASKSKSSDNKKQSGAKAAASSEAENSEKSVQSEQPQEDKTDARTAAAPIAGKTKSARVENSEPENEAGAAKSKRKASAIQQASFRDEDEESAPDQDKKPAAKTPQKTGKPESAEEVEPEKPAKKSAAEVKEEKPTSSRWSRMFRFRNIGRPQNTEP